MTRPTRNDRRRRAGSHPGTTQLGFVDVVTVLIVLALLLWAAWKQFPAYDRPPAPPAPALSPAEIPPPPHGRLNAPHARARLSKR